MNSDDTERLRHMLAAICEPFAFAEGKVVGDLVRDRLLLLVLVKEIEIIGEAPSRVSAEGRNAFPGIPWKEITGMRNRLTHGYFDWDLEVIWSTLTNNMPVLKEEVERALAGSQAG